MAVGIDTGGGGFSGSSAATTGDVAARLEGQKSSFGGLVMGGSRSSANMPGDVPWLAISVVVASAVVLLFVVKGR